MKKGKGNHRSEELNLMKYLSAFESPAISLAKEIKWFKIGLAVVVISSLGFFRKYTKELVALWRIGEIVDGKKVFDANDIMMDFHEILRGSLDGFYLLCILMLVVAGWHYFHYYHGSKSIYLMRRLPSRWEMHKRALVLPALAVIITLITAFVVMLIYFGLYMMITPKQCIAPGQWRMIWM